MSRPGPALLSGDEPMRLAAVRRYDVLDTPPDGAFDRITALAARHFDVPIAIVSIVDSDRIWFKSHHGLEIEQIGRDPGLCASAIFHDRPWIVEDAAVDPRTLANPLVAGEFGLRFYAGAPLTTRDGFNLGTLCVIDCEPRRLSSQESETLSDMAAIVMDELELRLATRRMLTGASVMALLVALETRDGYSGYHSRSVVDLALKTGRALGIPAEELADVENAALLHDVGKIGISDEILRKADKLTQGDWEQMRRHSEMGEQIIASMPSLAHLAPAVRAEHERWDGGGYPDGLRGEQIPLASRIVYVCDAYHAMISDRPYRAALAPSDALAELEAHAGTQFDPAVVAALVGAVRRNGNAPRSRASAQESLPSPQRAAARRGRDRVAVTGSSR